MKFVEYESLDTIIERAKSDPLFLCQINTDLDLTIAKQNGYKIFKIFIEDGDPFYAPDDLHGLRIYTILNNKIKDCKTIAIPFFEINTEKDKDFFKEYMYPDSDDFKVYVNNGYANILCYSQHMTNFEGENAIGKIGIILISDGMYTRRANALFRLLSIFSDTFN